MAINLNGPEKQNIYDKNNAWASSKIDTINRKLNASKYSLNTSLDSSIKELERGKIHAPGENGWAVFSLFIIPSIIAGIIAGEWGALFVVLLLGAFAGVTVSAMGNSKNDKIDRKIDNLRKETNNKIAALGEQAKKDIRKVNDDAEKKTIVEIASYDAQVEMYYNRIKKNYTNYSDMVEHQFMMFERMISHADNDSYIKFIEADLIYEVTFFGIKYEYSKSGYQNNVDDYSFEKRRFRNLNNYAQCEGLARALVVLTKQRMKKNYPKDSFTIDTSHYGSKVTMHYKGANKNFIPAKNIF